MRDLDYLTLLGHEYPTADSAAETIIRMKALCGMPKGTEYFFSDLHGEHRAFIHMLRSCSGIIKSKIYEAFGDELTEEEQLKLAELIYYPERKLKNTDEEAKNLDWQAIKISQLIRVTHTVMRKWTRHAIRKSLPTAYAHVIDELLHAEGDPNDKNLYYSEMMMALLETGAGFECIRSICELIRALLMDNLHIIGDIFDRGPRPDLIMDELRKIRRVDIQWGNHDVSWMGAAAGNAACIATVLRIATAYNCFDVLEDGYGINLRPLSMFAEKVYGNDDCSCFKPHLLDMNRYDEVSPELAAKICKAISIIEFKLEGQLVMRHPEYHMDNRLLLDEIDYERGVVTIEGREYALKDNNFPTIDPESPYELSADEAELVELLRMSFLHAHRLQKHIRFLFTNGSTYLIRNGNLLYHGCIPMNEKGSFAKVSFLGKPLSGRALFDEIEKRCTSAYYTAVGSEGRIDGGATDLFWYLWCGPESPLFGKDRMATFESFLVNDPELKVETYNPYYKHSVKEKVAVRILAEFGLDGERGHIINGHVPVKVAKGETPVKANGKLFVIDGGISKAYQKKTGIAGYTLIYNSHRLALAEHTPFAPGEEDTPTITSVEEMKDRVLIKDTDEGRKFMALASDLEELLNAYRSGLIKEGQVQSK